MIKDRRKYTKEDIYVRDKWFSRSEIVKDVIYLSGALAAFVLQYSNPRIRLLAIATVILIFIDLIRSAKRMEIHGDMLIYCNRLWKKKRFSIYDIDRIESSKKNDIVLYGKDGSKLVSFKKSMEEVVIALCYLENKGIPMEESLQFGSFYEEYYEECCKKAKTILSTKSAGMGEMWLMGFGRRRTNYLIKQESLKRKEAKKAARQMRSKWNIRQARLKSDKVAMEWRVNKNDLLSVAAEKGSALRLAKLRQYCMQEGIPVRKVLNTTDGSPYVIENGWFAEVKEDLLYFREITGLLGKREEGKTFCYEAGADFAKYQNILIEHPEFIKTDEDWTKKESRIKWALANKDSMLSQEEWRQLLNEVESVCEPVKKVCVPVTDMASIIGDYEKMQFSDNFLMASTEYEVSVWGICNYMASLATHSYMVTRGFISVCWYEYVEKMVEGYESVRPLTDEEKQCIPSLLRLAVALQIAENNHKTIRKKLIELYRFLVLKK